MQCHVEGREGCLAQCPKYKNLSCNEQTQTETRWVTGGSSEKNQNWTRLATERSWNLRRAIKTQICKCLQIIENATRQRTTLA